VSNFLSKQSFRVGKFQLDLHPYAAAPENRFEEGCALQYGADFRLSFTRGGSPKDKIGLIQLIFPQTKIFDQTVIGAWNVDKHNFEEHPIVMEQCLYGNEGVRIGSHSPNYEGEFMRSISEKQCSLVDTPREINGDFAHGVFTGVTNTKFANYVVALDSKNGTIFDQGIVWGYSVVQNAKNPATFDFLMQAPRTVLLSGTNEHLMAIANFLHLAKEEVKSFIS
jgi:hypothetical protein